MTPDPVDRSGPVGPDPAEGPLDPFDDDVALAEGTDDDPALTRPSVSSRLMASFIDLMAAYLLINLLNGIVIVSAVHPGKHLTAAQQRTELISFILVAVVLAAGFAALDHYTGRSLGKRLLKLRLMTQAGSRPSFTRLLVRYVLMFWLGLFVVPRLFGVGLGALVVLAALGSAAVQPQRRNIFDLLAGTRVVLDRG